MSVRVITAEGAVPEERIIALAEALDSRKSATEQENPSVVSSPSSSSSSRPSLLVLSLCGGDISLLSSVVSFLAVARLPRAAFLPLAQDAPVARSRPVVISACEHARAYYRRPRIDNRRMNGDESGRGRDKREEKEEEREGKEGKEGGSVALGERERLSVSVETVGETVEVETVGEAVEETVETVGETVERDEEPTADDQRGAQRNRNRTEVSRTAAEEGRHHHSSQREHRDAAEHHPSPRTKNHGRLLDSDELKGDHGWPEVEVVAVVHESAQRDGLKLAAACGATRAVIVDDKGDVTGAVAALAELLSGSELVTCLAVPNAGENEAQSDDGGASPAARALQHQLQDVTLEEGSALSSDGCSQSDISHYYATSGTTGAPKVVACTRGALTLYAESHAQAHNYTPASRILLASTPLFDPFVGEVSPSQSTCPKCCLCLHRSKRHPLLLRPSIHAAMTSSKTSTSPA